MENSRFESLIVFSLVIIWTLLFVQKCFYFMAYLDHSSILAHYIYIIYWVCGLRWNIVLRNFFLGILTIFVIKHSRLWAQDAKQNYNLCKIMLQNLIKHNFRSTLRSLQHFCLKRSSHFRQLIKVIKTSNRELL